MKRKFACLLLTLGLMLGLAASSYAEDKVSWISFGVLGDYPVDGTSFVAGWDRPLMLGGQAEVSFKDSPFSYKAQVSTGSSSLTYTQFNVFTQYKFPRALGVVPYLGLGYSVVSSSNLSDGGLGWLAGFEYPVSTQMKMGLYYNGFTQTSQMFFNHTFGFTVDYKFSI